MLYYWSFISVYLCTFVLPPLSVWHSAFSMFVTNLLSCKFLDLLDFGLVHEPNVLFHEESVSFLVSSNLCLQVILSKIQHRVLSQF
jgi:hypothetical protein